VPNCSHCYNPLRGTRDEVGARCPTCREPLYEQSRDPHQAPQQGQARDLAPGSQCPGHPRNPAVGTCQRCGNFFCAVCWSYWREQTLCSSCVERALEANDLAPVEVRAHLRQALLAMLCGAAAWLLTIGGGVLMAVGAAGEINPGPILLGFFAFLSSLLPSILGVGQGAAAIRARGNHMILATLGLILSGLHVGIILGLFSVSVLQE